MPRLSVRPSIVIALTFLAGSATASTPDTQGIVAHNDVVYLAPARQGWEGLPLGDLTSFFVLLRRRRTTRSDPRGLEQRGLTPAV
jgi:hypothetical protein